MKRDKRVRDSDPSQEGSLNRRSFQTPGNPVTGGSRGSFQITCLKATPSRKVPQTLASTTSKWGLNGEERAALLRVRTGPECPEGNLRELR